MNLPRFYLGTLGAPGDTADLHRLNDGSLIVMERDVLFSDATESWRENVPRLHIPRHTSAPRGKVWSTPDPAQEAFALALLGLMNAAPGGPWEEHVGEDYAVVMGLDESTEDASIRVGSGDMAKDVARRLNGLDPRQ